MAIRSWREAVSTACGEIVATHPVGGGSIADAMVAELATGERLFVKTFAGEPSMFSKEANGLRELAKAQALRIPEVQLVGDDFLVLEHIQNGQPATDFMEVFGRQFAQLHRFQSETYGFYEDNFCGATIQKNTPRVSAEQGWAGFYWEHRLLYQVRLAERRGYADQQLLTLVGKLELKLDQILAGSEEAPSLLHGDLWSGNYLCGPQGEPVLIDPAAYYGHREADLGMTHLFGNFGASFYTAYEEAYPLPAGSDYRINLYKLYHVLNHLNLFGRSYYGQAISLLQGYVS